MPARASWWRAATTQGRVVELGQSYGELQRPLGRAGASRRKKITKGKNKEDDRWAPLTDTNNGVKMSSILSLSTLPTKQKFGFNPPS